MKRELLNTESAGHTLYRALLPLLAQMREMDDRMLIGVWGCEVVEYPTAIKVGLHVTTHPKPHITTREMPIHNVGMFDRPLLKEKLLGILKETFPQFMSYACDMRISSFIHTGTNPVFNYIYLSDVGETKMVLDVSAVNAEPMEVEEPKPVMTRTDEIREILQRDYWSRIQEVCGAKGYHVPDFNPMFVTEYSALEKRFHLNHQPRQWSSEHTVTHKVLIFGFNPKSVVAESGSAVIRRNIPKMVKLVGEMRQVIPDCAFMPEFSIGVLPSAMARQDTVILPTLPEPMLAVRTAIERVNPSPTFMDLQDGRWYYRRTRDDLTWYIVYTTCDTTEDGYPVQPYNIRVIAELLGVYDTVMRGRHTLFTAAIGPTGLMTYCGYNLSRKWLHRTVLKEIKSNVETRMKNMEWDDPELPSAVWCIHALSPRRLDTFSAKTLKAFLDDIPTHWTPSLLRVLLTQYCSKNNGQRNHAWPKKVANAFNAIRENKRRKQLWMLITSSRGVPPELVAKARDQGLVKHLGLQSSHLYDVFRIKDLEAYATDTSLDAVLQHR